MPIDVEQFMCRSDNFGILVRDRETGLTALVDAPEEGTILAAIERTGWKPSLILTTHHHIDHVEANLALKQRFGLEIIAPAAEASKIPELIDVSPRATPLPSEKRISRSSKRPVTPPAM
jgi:hydroxyacylglutathione hydrolase